MATFVGKLEDGSAVWWGPDNFIKVLGSGGTCHVVAREHPSRPAISPGTRRLVYIAPSRWESLGNLYLWEVSTSKSKLLVGHDRFPRGCTPKHVVWFDEETLLMIVGYAFGSVSLGGNIFHVNVETGEVGLFATPGPKREYTGLEVTHAGVTAQLVEYSDNWFPSNQRQTTFDRNQIERRVRRQPRPEKYDF